MCTVCHDHTPHTSRPRRTTAAPLKLQPLQLALALPGDTDGNPVDRRSATESGDPSCRKNVQRQQHGQNACSGGSGSGGGTCRGGGPGASQYSTGTMTSPSLDILTCDYRRAGSDTAVIEPTECVASAFRTSATDATDATTAMGVSFPATAVTVGSASGSSAVKEGEQTRETRVGSARTAPTIQEAEVGEIAAAVGGGAESDAKYSAETPANTQNMKEGSEEEFRGRREGRKLCGRKGARKEEENEYEEGEVDERDPARCSTAKGDEERGDAGEEAEDEQGARGGHVPSTTRKTAVRRMRRRTTMKKDYSDVVLPMALPGEAHEMSFGAAARAIVLASGSSRFTVSR